MLIDLYTDGKVSQSSSYTIRAVKAVQMSTITVVSGPAGVGKGTILERVLSQMLKLEIGVSWTTREARPGDVGGIKKYKYVTRAEFMAAVERGEFVEWNEYAGNLYGSHIGEEVSHLLLEIEVKGAQEVARRNPDALLIGILPPGGSPEAQLEAVALRLRGRGSDDEAAIQKRLATAPIEMEAIRTRWPHIVVNSNIDQAEAEVVALIEAHINVA